MEPHDAVHTGMYQTRQATDGSLKYGIFGTLPFATHVLPIRPPLPAPGTTIAQAVEGKAGMRVWADVET